MSWDVDLIGEDGPVPVDAHEEGGTYALGGIATAELNVTYNYGQVYRELFGHNLIDWLDGKQAKDTLPILRDAVTMLGDKPDDDYWEPTNGNAGHAVAILLKWADAHPEAKWSVV